MVEAATEADLASWLELVREVEWLFGPMPKFDMLLKRKIREGDALCVRDGGRVMGGLLLGGVPKDTWIRWLAVRRDARQRGIGSALVEAALTRSRGRGRISVVTFGADNPDGLPARRLYERHHFQAGEMLPRDPDGGTRQLYVLVWR